MNKEDFPIFNKFPHLIYLDNAATTQKPSQMIDTLSSFYGSTNANVHRGIYELSELASNAYEKSRQIVAKFINADSANIIFTSGTTMGLNLIAKYVIEPNLKDDDVIVISLLEHHSNILPWQEITKIRNAHLEYINLNGKDLDYDSFAQIIKTKKVKAVSLTMMSNVTGFKPEINKIKDMLMQYSPETILIADAAQYIAHDKLDVRTCGADIVVFSAHKLYGPMGLGVLYINPKLMQSIPPFFKGGGMINSVSQFSAQWAEAPEKFEAGTPPVAEAVAFSASLEYVDSIGLDKIMAHERELSSQLISGLRELNDFNLLVKEYDALKFGPVISFTHRNIHAHDLAQLLSYENVAMRSGHHCAQPLHDHLAIASSIRASIGMYNTKQDIENTLEVLKHIKI
jgi:cysteine desulfurase/selenocysteine lyase